MERAPYLDDRWLSFTPNAAVEAFAVMEDNGSTTVDGEVVSFVIAMPDMTEGIQKARGRLFPFGFMKILKAAKKTKQLDLLLGAIKKSYRGRGLDGIMGVKMIQSAHEAGLEVMDTHHEMESNVKVRAEMLRIGGKLYKRFRIFQKEL